MNGLTLLVAVAACFYATYNLYDIAKARRGEIFTRGIVSTRLMKLTVVMMLHSEGFDIEVNDGVLAQVIKRATAPTVAQETK